VKIKTNSFPKEILNISQKMKAGGFEVFVVGGCVRDILLGNKPKDWDIATNATPEKIQGLFPDSFYENTFGTVGVKSGSDDPALKVVEITPYRKEAGYSDKRHPDSVIFSHKLDDDLGRRDFTINALAVDPDKGQITDNYSGLSDLEKRLIRAVGSPDKRFGEDALRMLRAVRFAAELDFVIEKETAESISKNAGLIGHISNERIGEEFKKIIQSKNPAMGLALAQKLHILSHTLPELEEMVGVSQNKEAHKYDVWEHSLRALQHAADKNFSLEVRLAALFHDSAKPATKRQEDGKTTFYGHEVVGAKVARETLRKLAFPKEVIEKVEKLIRCHMFFSDTEQITPSAVRRLINKVSKENIWELVNLRICDRVGTGRPKEEPYRLRKFQSMIEEVIRDPISVSMLKIDGNDIIKEFHVEPGPRIGYVLSALLEEVLEDPTRNNKKFLVKHTAELLKLPDGELKGIGEAAREVKTEVEKAEITKIRRKRGVK